MPTVEGAGVPLVYEERGSGRPLLVVHGLGEDRTTWLGMADSLAAEARVVVYDRRGYGESGAPEPYERTTVEEQAEDAAALLAALGIDAAVMVGADLGALVVLDLLKRRPGVVQGAVLLDPPLFLLSSDATEPLSQERAQLEESLRHEGPAQAAGTFLTGRGLSDEHAARDHAAVFADYSGAALWPVTRRELAGFDVPVTIVCRPGAPLHVRAAAEELAIRLPRARFERELDLVHVVRELL